MEYGYKKPRESPTIAGGVASSMAQAQAEMMPTTTTASSASATPMMVKKRVLKTRKSDESVKGTQRCSVSDVEAMDMAEEPRER